MGSKWKEPAVVVWPSYSLYGGFISAQADVPPMDPGCFRRAAVLSLFLLLLASAVRLPDAAAAPIPPSAFAAAHAPILIEGNAGFTATNGVVSGSGTVNKPYVIGPWDIDATASPGVWVRNTTAYFVLQDVNVTGTLPYGFPSAFDSVVFTNVVHGSAMRINVTGTSRGVVLDGGSFLSVQDSVVTNTPHDAIVAAGTDNVSLLRNDLRGWSNLYGVHLIGVANATLGGNLFDGCGIYLDTTDKRVLDTTSITPDNLVNGLPIRFYRQVSGLAIDGLATGQLIVVDSSNVRVANLAVAYGETGLEFDFVRGLNLTSSSSTSSRRIGVKLLNVSDAWASGVSVTYGSGPSAVLTNVTNVTIESSAFKGAGASAVVVSGGHDVYFSRDEASSEGVGVGIGLDRVDGFGVWDSNLSYNAVGLSLSAASSGSVTANAFYGNGAVSYGYPTGAAIHAVGSTTVDVRGNNVTANGIGVWAEASTGLRFAANRFLGNAKQAADDSLTDFWNDPYPFGGNFWSDYRGYDDCHGPGENVCPGGDGLGDTPYAIATTPDLPGATDLDRYPLVPVNPPNLAPVATILASTLTPWTGQSVTFDGTDSYDPDGSIVLYEWSFGDGYGAAGHTVPHAFRSAGTYSVTLTVTDNRYTKTATTVSIVVATWIQPSVPLVSWACWRGYSLPVPSAWSQQVNASIGANSTVDLFAYGTYNGTPANLVVMETFDLVAREDRAYLWQTLNGSAAVVRQQYPGVVVTDVTFRTLSGHAAIVGVLRYGVLYQDLAIIVRGTDRHVWAIILTAAASEEANLNGTFQQILTGFTITASEAGGAADLLSALLMYTAVAALVGAAIAGIGGWLYLRSRRRRPRMPLTPPAPPVRPPP